ncbi:MAG TPA: hypothetical protein VF198_00145 [Vicinamibacterales bacterium]
MSSRPLRLLLLLAALGAAAAGSYVIYSAERALAEASAAAAGYMQRAQAAIGDLHAMRAAQQAYVAEGQGADYWMRQADDALGRLERAMADLAAASGAEARTSLEGVAASVKDFRALDARAREYVRQERPLMASEVIFTDSLAVLARGVDQLQAAMAAELAARQGQIEALRGRQIYAGAGAVALLLLFVMLLVPVPERDVDVLTAMRALTESAPLRKTASPSPGAAAPASATASKPVVDWVDGVESSARVISRVKVTSETQASAQEKPAESPSTVQPAPVSAEAPQPAAETTATESGQPAQEPAVEPAAAAVRDQTPAVDLPEAARICAELARVLDGGDIPALLARAAALLDAPGLIVWVIDRQGTALYPLLTHGYPQQVVMRLGSLPADADNATAAAWRTGRTSVLPGENGTPGALVIPIVTAEGCIGVLAAEIAAGRESRDEIQALATIFAAQLATVVAPVASEQAQAAR